MFSIKITDAKTNKPAFEGLAEHYLLLTKSGSEITRNFSTHDLVLQLGMLNFVNEQILEQLRELTKGEENENRQATRK